MNPSKRKSLKSAAIAFAFIGISCLIRAIYVFKFTDYHHYLVSDMGGYWVRATEWMRGDHHGINQWAIWPPLYHIVLANAFTLMTHLGVKAPHWLACILGVQIVLGSISVYCLYLIALSILRNEKAAIVVGVLYLLTFPIIYLNAFLLSENTGLPLVIIAVCILIRRPRSVPWLVISGLILGIATGIRPAYVMFGAGFFVFALASQGSRRGAFKALAFAVGYVPVIAGICLLTSWMSYGHVRGMSANGGLNFFIAQAKMPSVVMHYPMKSGSYTFGIGAPQFAEEQWRGKYETNQPPYNQAFFVKEGMKYLREPGTWADDFTELRKLFFGPLFPYMSTAKGNAALEPVFKILTGVLMLAALVLTPIVWYLRGNYDRSAALLWSFMVMVVVTSYFFGSERRYGYSMIFSAYPVLFSLFFPARKPEIEQKSS